jgi:hypothetical protein
MAAELKVGVGADVKDLEKGMKQGEQAVKQFAESSEKSLTLTDKSVKTFSKTAATETKKVGVAFQGMSRVMSDAAFGPGAIANNLAGLGDDFRQLSLQAKESGQSIGKTLIQSLTGAGGLNLALGGLTLGMSLASFGLGAWTRMFGDSTKKVKEGADGIKEYITSLDALAKASLTGAQNSQEELAHLKVLFNAYQDANLPLKARKDAYKEIQDKYPAYFQNIQFEATATGKTTEAYNKLTQAILATGRARAAEGLIAENSKKQLVNEQKIIDEERNRIGLIKEAALLKNKLDKLNIGASEAGAIRAQDLANAQIAATNQVAESIALTNSLKAANNKLTEENLRLLQQVNAEVLKGASLSGNVGGSAVDPTFNAVKELPGMKALKGAVTGSGTIKAPTIDFGAAKESLALFSQSMLDFNAQMSGIINNGIISAFAGMGEGIGAALAAGTSVIDAVGAGLLASLGGILVQLGQLAIETGIGIKAIQTALKTLNPTVAIAAGVALVALGSFVKGQARSIGNQGGGGGGFGSPSAPGSGFQPGAVQFANGQSASTIVASYTIKGQDLHTILTRTTALNGRMGAK